MTSKKTKKTILNFNMQHQQQLAWCWSAVSTSCALFYDSDSGWTQCKVASKSIVPSPGNCCGADASGLKCDIPWPLLSPDETEGAFITTHIPSRLVTGPLLVQTLLSELDKGRLVAYRLEIALEHEIDVVEDGQTIRIPKFWHFVVIAGYEINTAEINDHSVTVYVFDPLDEPDPVSLKIGHSTMSYATFLENYKCHGGVVPDQNNSPDKETSCKVTNSYLTTPI